MGVKIVGTTGNKNVKQVSVEKREPDLLDRIAPTFLAENPHLISPALIPFTGATRKPANFKGGDRNFFGNIGERPDASVRAFLRAEPKNKIDAYIKASVDPTDTETFQSEVIGQAQQHPDVFKNIVEGTPASAFGLGLDMVTSPLSLLTLGLGSTPVINAIKNIPTASVSVVNKINKVIDANIFKGVKPSLGGKKTFSNIKKFKESGREAVKAIVRNKKNLQVIDKDGDLVTRLPETNSEFSQSIVQTRDTLFKQWNKLAKQANKKGSVQLKPIAKELDKVIKDKTIMIQDPSIIEYAKGLKARLLATKELKPTELDKMIKSFNEGLNAYYRNPTFETAKKATIDAGVSNMMRKHLNDFVSGVADPKFQTLKNQYGSLKAIEGDVTRRAMHDLNKNVKSLVDFTDVFSGGRIVEGLTKLDPARVSSGVAQKGIAQWLKKLNDPNRNIKTMFKEVDKLMNKNPAGLSQVFLDSIQRR